MNLTEIKKTKFVTPFLISWKFDNRNFINADPECGTILLNAWDRVHQKRRYFGVGIRCKAEVFEAITGNLTLVQKEKRSEKKWADRVKPLNQRERNQIIDDNRILKRKLDGAMLKVQELNSFDVCRNLEQFKKKFDESTSYYVIQMFDLKIQDLENNKQWKTARSYKTVKNSLLEFRLKDAIKNNLSDKDKRTKGEFSFSELDTDFLKAYDDYLKENGADINGVASYMRCIKHIYNRAIEMNVAKRSFYPFGSTSKKYKINTRVKTKETLNKEDWSKLMKYETPYPARTQALDMFKLSYALNGANTYDICTMLKTDLKDEHIEFYRKKTDRVDQNIARVVGRTKFIDHMLVKYQADIDSDYLLNILDSSDELDTEETRKKCDRKNNAWGKQLRKISKALGIKSISPLWARHQRSTDLVDLGATMEEIKTIHGHDNMKTTRTYVHSLPNAQKIKEKAENLDSKLGSY